MKKITTLFKKDPNNLGRVINEVSPENEWAFLGYGKPTRKLDGTACATFNGELFKRYDVKKGKSVPFEAIPCQYADPITGHWPHWVKCDRANPADKWHFEAFDINPLYFATIGEATFELIGPKINGNKEKLDHHRLIKHGDILETPFNNTFEALQIYLSTHDIEGIVYHHPDGRMCKIRKSDFGIKR